VIRGEVNESRHMAQFNTSCVVDDDDSWLLLLLVSLVLVLVDGRFLDSSGTRDLTILTLSHSIGAFGSLSPVPEVDCVSLLLFG